MSKTIAFLDACVLYPFSLRDILIQFSVNGMFQAKWSSKARIEAIRNIEKNNIRLAGRLDRTFDLMAKAIPDYSSEPSPATIALVAQTRTDPKDVDILAAAIDGSCTHLVTSNLRDFDIAYGAARGVAVIHPDEFLDQLIEGDPRNAKSSFNTIIARCKRPPRSKTEYCRALQNNQMPKTASRLASL